MNDKVNLAAKAHGPFVWHKHEETNDFSLVVSGHPTIHLRDRGVELSAGESWSLRAASSTAPRPGRRRTSSSSRRPPSTLAAPEAR